MSASRSEQSPLGLDLEEIGWKDLSLCRGDDTNDHYDNYENNPRLAKTIDQKCLSCPVLVQCLTTGVENGEWGVWGGIFLTSGKVDKNKNAHKTEEVWDELKERLGGLNV